MKTNAIPDLFSYDYVIFDLDGTLVDSMPAWAKAYAAAIQELYGIDVDHGESCFHGNRHMRFMQLLTHCLAPHGHEVDEEAYRRVEVVMSKKFEAIDVPYFHGAIALVDDLYDRGRKLFCSSFSGCSTVALRLKQGGILQRFDLALGSSDRCKKGPAHIDRIAKYLNVDRSTLAKRGVLVGDTVHDMEIAANIDPERRFRMDAIAVLGSARADDLLKAGATHIVPTISCLFR